MKNIINRILRRLIISNRYLIPCAGPRLPVKESNLEYTFTGTNSLDQLEKNYTNVFSGFDSHTSVLIKININSALDYPASVSMEMLETIIRSLKKSGVKKICIADCTALSRLPSKGIISKKALKTLQRPGVKITAFDFGSWRQVSINAKNYRHIILPKLIYKYDKIINLANLKTHRVAGFTCAAKNLVGFMHPYQRYELHGSNLEERIAEIPLSVIPDLNIIDARKVFISGGPDFGEVRNTDTIIIDSNLVRADIKAYKLLTETQSTAGVEGLPSDYTKNPILKALVKNMGYLK